jgi:predicted transcriptional regulator
MKERVAEIVAAYLKNNQVPATELPALISAVNASLGSLGEPVLPPVAVLIPAVSIRRSVTATKITCLECGWSGQMIKRHLTTAHDTNADAYRTRWGLGRDYPVVAKGYSSRRSELAKSAGLGTRRGPRGSRKK